MLSNKKIIGLDISDHTIELVEIEKVSGGVRISNSGRCFLKPGLVEYGRIKDQKSFTEFFVAFLKKINIVDLSKVKVVFGLPESQVYLRIFSIKDFRKGTNAQIKQKIEEGIPIQKEDLIFNYKILKQEKNLMEVLSIATDKNVLLEWQKFFYKLKINIDFFDVETLANFRGMFLKEPTSGICVVDIGAETANISIFGKKGICYSYAIQSAGNRFTKNIAEIRSAGGEKIGEEKAEVFKKEYGISVENEYQKEIQLALEGLFVNIGNEVDSAIKYCTERFSIKVTNVVFIGGSSRTKGLPEFVGGQLLKAHKNLRISLGNSIFSKQNVRLEFIEAVGLGLGFFGKKYLYNDTEFHFFPIKEDNKDDKKKKQKSKKKENKRNDSSWVKNHPKEIQLIVVLLLGIILVPLAFWYRGHDATKRNLALQEKYANKYSFQNNLEFEVTIGIDGEEGNVPGRIVIEELDSAIDYEKAIADISFDIEKEITQNEFLWPQPLNKLETDTVVFPVDLKWIVFKKNIVDDYIAGLVKEIFNENDFEFNNIEYVDLHLNGTSSQAILKTNVIVSTIEDLSDYLDTEDETEKQEIVVDKEEKIYSDENLTDSLDATDEEENFWSDIEVGVVKNTGTGWLNIRSGPGTNYEIVEKVIVGDQYIILDEQDGWFELQLSDDISGWGSSQYIGKIE